MCFVKTPKPPSQPVIAQPDNAEAIAAADAEAALRKKRAGAAANVLTSPTGIPAATKSLGGVAA